ncbi:MAG TPA: GntR family transcriptional regulator, partial [Acidimicrobiales bacterium]|nr:GntR family transcriptional regulator [Acidimicrobiales bacterium]
ETPQLGTRVYQALLDSILGGQIELGAPLRPDVIARQLEVSTTPVREAMQRLESDGLSIKLPNRGWFVREFTKEQIRDLYEFRASLECLGVRLACQRMTPDDLERMRDLQITGQTALDAHDMSAYRAYNQNFHMAILDAARNSYLSSVMGQLRLQNELLMIKTMRIVGRPLRAIEEHARMIELLAARDAASAQELMSAHILGALEDLLRTFAEESLTPA